MQKKGLGETHKHPLHKFRDLDFTLFKGGCLLHERTSIMPGHHQDKKRREEENGATDGSQHPLASFCVREKKQKQVQRNLCRAMEIQERRKLISKRSKLT